MGSGLIPVDTGFSLAPRLGILMAGFAVGAVTWCFGMSFLVASTKRFVGRTTLRVVHAASSIALAYFALDMLWTTWHNAMAPALFPHRSMSNAKFVVRQS